MLNNSYSIEEIKKMGKDKSIENLHVLIDLYDKTYDVIIKREIASSIGRHYKIYPDEVLNFSESRIYAKDYMDVIYQLYRTLLANYKNEKYRELADKVEVFYDNEAIYKMKAYKLRKKKKKEKNIERITEPLLLEGNSVSTLKSLPEQSIQLIFTSPPYYNARIYSDYTSYEKYLSEMEKVFTECSKVLEDGRFIIVNVSPVITKRPGREYESIRYPIHFDLHKVLERSGFYFVDEIIWIKPEPSVPNRNGGYMQTKRPLSYKPNCITESIMVYRKNCDFLLDENIKKYKTFQPNNDDFDVSNCWYIAPKSSKDHPAVFPEELCNRILKYYSYEGDVVMDPFAGSGTFGEVALDMKRIPVLCEINTNYINNIKRRLNLWCHLKKQWFQLQ